MTDKQNAFKTLKYNLRVQVLKFILKPKRNNNNSSFEVLWCLTEINLIESVDQKKKLQNEDSSLTELIKRLTLFS